MNKDGLWYVAGHQGLVGSSLMRQLATREYARIITKTFQELDLRYQSAVEDFFQHYRPDYVMVAAATVGGIYANATNPAPFLYDNVMIAANIIHAAYRSQVKKLLFLGSSCIYPRDALQPIQEEYLLTGPLEVTNEGYALAKIVGIKLCQAYQRQYGMNFISAMPTNLYGPGDVFDEHKSHVVPGLITKMVRAQKEGHQEVVIWGSGKQRRDLLFVDDCAEALMCLMHYHEGNEFFNIGSGMDYSIQEIAYMIRELVGFEGDLIFDTSRPDGTFQKILDIQKIKHYGWKPKTTLYEGLKKTIEWYRAQNNPQHCFVQRSVVC